MGRNGFSLSGPNMALRRMLWARADFAAPTPSTISCQLSGVTVNPTPSTVGLLALRISAAALEILSSTLRNPDSGTRRMSEYVLAHPASTLILSQSMRGISGKIASRHLYPFETRDNLMPESSALAKDRKTTRLN